MEILLIGFGAMAKEVVGFLEEDRSLTWTGVLARRGCVESVRHEVSKHVRVYSAVAEIHRLPRLVVECAGHEAVRVHGPSVLRRGSDLVVISTGALADSELQRELRESARAGGSRLVLPAGAIAAIDALSAAKIGGLRRVLYTSRKPPAAWKGTVAEEAHDLDKLNEATVIFRGAASEAASLYPQNANVAATIALAGIGFRRTVVEIVADPDAIGNTHRLLAEGSFGRFDLEVCGNPLEHNPKTSKLAAYSIVRAIKNRLSDIVF